MTQIEYVNKIIEINKAYPNAEIHFMVASDETEEDYSYTEHKIKDVVLTNWFVKENDESLYDIDMIIDYLELTGQIQDTMSESEITELVASKTVPAIIVYTGI